MLLVDGFQCVAEKIPRIAASVLTSSIAASGDSAFAVRQIYTALRTPSVEQLRKILADFERHRAMWLASLGG